MTFVDIVKDILAATSDPITPQDIRELIKNKYPQYYGTPSHINNVAKGHYKNLDHALLAQIYGLVRMKKSFFCDKNHKPMKISLRDNKASLKMRPLIITNEDNIKNEEDLIKNIDHYYNRSLEVSKEFGGPSIYFHVQAIKEQETDFLSDRHIEMIYATLASWGMHKMGNPEATKAKMVEFPEFKNSIIKHRAQLKKLSSLTMDSCNQKQYGESIENALKQIYYSLVVSISDATIVAHSKTLAHILPNLIPPIDRQYTIRFFTQEYKDFFAKSGKYRQVNLPRDRDVQFADFKEYCCRIKMLIDQCDHQLFTIDKESFNTSIPKIMDNLIMAFVKDVPKPEKAAKRK